MASLGKQDFFDGSDPKTAGAGKYAGNRGNSIIKNNDLFVFYFKFCFTI